MTVEVHGGPSSNGALCLEILGMLYGIQFLGLKNIFLLLSGTLRRSLTKQSDVRLSLYEVNAVVILLLTKICKSSTLCRVSILSSVPIPVWLSQSWTYLLSMYIFTVYVARLVYSYLSGNSYRHTMKKSQILLHR